MKYQHEELIQTKDRKIQNLESQHKEFIKNTVLKLRMMKEMKDKADSEVVNPVRPGFRCWINIPVLLSLIIMIIIPYFCGRNIPLDSIVEFDEYYYLKLNTAVSFTGDFAVYKLEESRDWFIIKKKKVNGDWVIYIMHHSEEETKDVFHYSIKYFNDRIIRKPEIVRCAPMGISPEDAVHNNFTTNWQSTIMIFTMYKA